MWLLTDVTYPTSGPGMWTKPEPDSDEKERKRYLELLNWSEPKLQNSALGSHFMFSKFWVFKWGAVFKYNDLIFACLKEVPSFI